MFPRGERNAKNITTRATALRGGMRERSEPGASAPRCPLQKHLEPAGHSAASPGGTLPRSRRPRVTASGAAAGPAAGPAISRRPRRGSGGRPTTSGVRFPASVLRPAGRPPRLRPRRPAPPTSSRPEPARGQRRGRLTPDLARPSPYRLRSHLTRRPRAGSSISRGPRQAASPLRAP